MAAAATEASAARVGQRVAAVHSGVGLFLRPRGASEAVDREVRALVDRRGLHGSRLYCGFSMLGGNGRKRPGREFLPHDSGHQVGRSLISGLMGRGLGGANPDYARRAVPSIGSMRFAHTAKHPSLRRYWAPVLATLGTY